MAAGPDLGPQGLGIGLLEEGPDDRGRPPAGDAREPGHLLGREQVLRQEPVKTAVIDLADERLHGGDRNTAAGRTPREIDATSGRDATGPQETAPGAAGP